MVSDKAKAYLRSRFGDHDYSYEMSDYNLESLIRNIRPETFDQLDSEARRLEATIRWIRRRQEEMKA